MLAAAISNAAIILTKAAQPETARLDAELLAAHQLGVTRSDLLLDLARYEIDRSAYAALVQRRATGEPLAYITGRAEFWSLTLCVTPDTLIPRADSETLIELALAKLPQPPKHVLDLGTGSGCLLLAALSEYEDVRGLGIDASAAALSVAQNNAERLGLMPRTAFRVGDWCDGLADRYDLILCNPPYVEPGAVLGPEVLAHEPHQALFADGGGLDDYRRLLPQLPARLTGNGLAVIEIGAGQGADVRAIAAAAGLTFAGSRNDLARHERALSFRRAQD